mgnify:CR=1 FL=1|jgi:hypothetical protein
MGLGEGVTNLVLIGLIILFLPILVPIGICLSGGMLVLSIFGTD